MDELIRYVYLYRGINAGKGIIVSHLLIKLPFIMPIEHADIYRAQYYKGWKIGKGSFEKPEVKKN
jgi:hypothetical protein